jgi:hypothetical protein
MSVLGLWRLSNHSTLFRMKPYSGITVICCLCGPSVEAPAEDAWNDSVSPKNLAKQARYGKRLTLQIQPMLRWRLIAFAPARQTWRDICNQQAWLAEHWGEPLWPISLLGHITDLSSWLKILRGLQMFSHLVQPWGPRRQLCNRIVKRVRLFRVEDSLI